MVKLQEELVEMYQGVQLSCLARLLEGSLETTSMAFGADGRPEQCLAIEGDATEVGRTQMGCLVGLMALVQELTAAEEEKKKMRAAFEEKVESVQRQLQQLQKQLKEGEAAKVGWCPSSIA